MTALYSEIASFRSIVWLEGGLLDVWVAVGMTVLSG